VNIQELKTSFSAGQLIVLAEREGLAVKGNRFQCPGKCSDDPRSCAVSDVDGKAIWECHHCKIGGSVIDFAMALRDVDEHDAILWLEGADTPAVCIAPKKPPMNGADLWPTLSPSDDAGERYLASRGLAGALGEVRFNVGSSGNEWLDARARSGYRVAVPLKDFSGAVRDFQLRSVSPTVDKKFAKLSLVGTRPPGNCFGNPDAIGPGKRIYVAEGMADTLALRCAGVDAIGAPGCEQLAKLALIINARSEVVCCPQNDAKHQSENGFNALRIALGKRGRFSRVLTTPAPHKDLAEWIQAVGVEAFRRGLEVVSEPSNPHKQPTLAEAQAECAPDIFAPSISAPKDDEWPEPERLDLDLLPVLPLDPQLIPEAFRAWCLDESFRLQCPLEFIAIPAMVSVGSVIGRQVEIRPLERDTWGELANMWGMIIGMPSERKSPAFGKAMAPIRHVEALEYKAFDERNKKYEKDEKVKRTVLEGLIKKLIAKGQDHSEAQARLDAIPPPPSLKRYIVSNVTPEKLIDLIVENPNGLLQSVDELAGWLAGFEKEGREDMRTNFLSGWSGKEGVHVDRIGRGSSHAEHVCLSVIGTIQPPVWSSYVRDSMNGSKNADGLAQRFQFAVWPDSTKSTRVIDQYPDHEARQRATKVFEALANIDLGRLEARQGEFDKVPFLRFDEAAQAFAKEYLRLQRGRMFGDDEHEAVKSHRAKSEKTFASIALAIALVDWADGTGPGGCVSKAALDKAIGWIEYLESHSKRIYSCATKESTSGLKVLSAKIRAGALGDCFSARDVLQRTWAGLSSRLDVEKNLTSLVDAGWLREMVQKPLHGGRSTTKYVKNPKIR
jgi:hypothetical protein